VNLTTPLIHLAARLLDVADGFDLVHRRLRSLELLTLADDGTRFRETLAQLAGAPIGRLRPLTPQETGGDGTGGGCRGAQERETGPHRLDATLRDSSCPVLRRAFPPARRTAPLDRRKEEDGNVTDYEILLLLDAELPEERQEEIVARARDLIERGGGRFDGHDAWGRRKLAYEIDRKAEGTYHLLTFAAEAATLDEVSRVLKITDGVLRHIAVRRPRGSGARAAPPTQAPTPAEMPEEAVSATRPDE
jgi:small subunit ribosomal protein S6